MATSGSAPTPREANPPFPRLLLVSDEALADIDQLPRSVRALIDAAADLYVVTPSLPRRSAWLADEVDHSRHDAEDRLNAVLDHMRSIGARASGRRGDDTALTAVDDAVAEFQPDHILVALRGEQHANWQEKGLIRQIRERFGLPLTTYVVGRHD
jgi:hypothetical protein